MASKRTEKAEALAKAIYATNEAWCVSVPGADRQMRVEALPGSPLVDVLSEKYRLTKAGSSQRFVPHAIVSDVRDARGNLVRRTTHAGLVDVDVWLLELPT